jgi:hypothetical protein
MTEALWSHATPPSQARPPPPPLQTQVFSLPTSLLGEAGLASANGEGDTQVTVTLTRVGPKKKDSARTLFFAVNGQNQECEVRWAPAGIASFARYPLVGAASLGRVCHSEGQPDAVFFIS